MLSLVNSPWVPLLYGQVLRPEPGVGLNEWRTALLAVSLDQIIETALDEAQPGARTRDIAEARPLPRRCQLDLQRSQ